MTLAEYIRSLPAARVERAANDLGEAARIEAEHVALPGAIFDTPEAAEGSDPGGVSGEVRPELSFDLSDDDSVRGFISGMEVSHPELVNRLRRDERAWDEMVALDRGHMTRLQRDGGVKFSGDDNADYDFYRWAYGRGMLASDTSLGGLASAFGRGFLQIVKGAAKLTGTAAKSVVNPTAGVELAATAVDAAQAAVAEYQQLGAGIAALTSGDDPQVRMAAMYELAKFSDEEQRTHNAWRKAISDSFAEVPVDEDSVEFLSETFDVSNLIGAGAGKLVTRGLKRVGASGAAELLGLSRTAFGSEMLASTLSKVPLVGAPYKRAILVGQADLLSTEAQVAYEAVARAQAALAAKRATLAASPASDPKDVLLRKVAEAETDVAGRLGEFNSAKSKLDSVRRNVAETLDLEGRGLLNLAAAGAVEGTGTLVRGTGRTMTRAYRGLSELLTGEADNAAFDMAAGQVAGGLANKGNIITRLGQDIVTAGRTMAQNGATIPYFRRLRQAEDATKLTRGAAAFIDWSHLGWAADKLGDTVKAGAAGAPVSGGFGYVASGGDLAAAVESAGAGAAYGIGGGAYGQWEAYKDPRFRYEELLSNRREFRGTLSAREVGGASQLQIFDQLDAGDQLAIASYAQGKPDVAFRFINDRNQASGYYDRDNNVVVINRASKTPLADIFRHEVAHFGERHGLQASVRELYLGDAEKGVIGQFTALDPLGNPVFVESTEPDGTTRYRYRLNDAGEKLKAEYTAKIRAVDPTFSMSDEYLASEVFAEQYADYLFGGRFRRDLSRNAFDNVVEALAGKPVVKNFLGGIGLLFDSDDSVVGTGVFRELKGNEGVRRLISGFTADVAKGRKPAIEESVEQHVFTETELRDPELATKWLQGGGAMRFGPDGRPVYDAKGVPQFLTEKEADAQQRDLANELIAAIEKHVAENPADADVLQRREIIDVNGVKRTLFSGRRIPAAVIESLEAQRRFNPHQLAHLRAASASVEKHGTGAMIAHFYQAASRKLGGKAYKTVGGRWRRDGVVGFQITKDGNVVINSVSWEQLAENARRAAGQKLAREIYATSGVPVDAAIMADVKTYLGNVIDGRPGATGIGVTRRDFINHLFGIRMASNEDVNPFFASIAAPKTVLTNLRLDRINRLAPLDHVEVAWGPQNYRRVKANMRPEEMVSETAGDFVGKEVSERTSSYRPDDVGFFSQLERTLEAIPIKATDEQIRAALRDGVKEKGQIKERPVRREEMEDVKDLTGRSFASWLNDNPDATRNQMLDFVRENRVRLAVTKLDGDARFYIARDGIVDRRNLFRTRGEAYDEISRRQNLMFEKYTITGDGMSDEYGKRVYSVIEEPDGTFTIRSADGGLVEWGHADRGEARRFLEHKLESIIERDGERYEVGEDDDVASRFSEYALPGGKNYREHILTLPVSVNGYQSPHFPEKGYLAHVRTNERLSLDGGKVYFAEEIQSDLHQTGRRQGYRRRDYDWEQREQALKKAYQEALDRSEQIYRALMRTAIGEEGYHALRSEYLRLEQEADDARSAWIDVSQRPSGGKVPDAPFKNSWHELGFKYLLGEAVRSGAEFLAWTTGRQQNDRYSLSTRANAVSYVKLEDGKYWVEAMPKGRDRDWISVGRFEKNELAGALGREIADRIVKGDGESIRHTQKTLLSRVDLEVGGEGMRGFYDRIIPQFADKYLKKYGIKTQGIQLATGEDVHAVPITPDLRADVQVGGQPQYRPDTPEQKQPARNENAFTRSLEHIKEAIPPAERFVGRFEPGKPILRPSGRDWHSGDAEAPVGDLGFSQRVIDDAFQAAVSESGPAAQKAVDALGEAGDRMIPPSDRHWAEAGRNLKLVDRLWYEYSSEAMRKAFPGEDPKARLIQVADQIAATSPLADPNYNAELAISILSEMERGGPIFTPAVNMSGVSDAALGKFGAGESRKVGSFSETFKFLGGAHDEPPLTTNDRQVAASFGIPDAAFGKYPVLYEVVSRFYNHLRDDYNARHGLVEGVWHGDDNGPMQSHQLQAISWVQTRAETRMENRKEITEEEAFNGDAYHQAFKLAAERLREGGVNVPVDENGDPKFTREVLQDPRVTSILAPTTDDFRLSLMLTQEIGTNLTEVGREFGELVAKSKELGITKNLEEAEKITNRYLNALGQRTKVEGKAKKEPSVMGKLVSAFAGKAIDVSRIEKGWGSFEGEFSKNLRVPIDDVPEQYREAFISVIGRQLKQAAGAASKFVSTDSAQPASGATRTYTVFLPGVLEPTADVSLLAKHLSSSGHEVNVSERPNGLVIDINPSFGADGPKGIDFQMLQSLVVETFGEAARIYAADHSSYFVESSEYGAKISHARKQLLDDAARSISQFFPSRRAAKDFLRSEAPSAGEIAQAGDARRAEAVRARYAESLRLLESAEKDLAKVARDYERDMAEAIEVLRKRITRKGTATQSGPKSSGPPS